MDDEGKVCSGCGKVYYPAGKWIHKGCKRLENRRGDVGVEATTITVDGICDNERNNVGSEVSGKQRWSREAYQRDYLRKRRAK
jgi:hypothetical protein